ncbi:MAG: response regulator transcription factor [Paludibacteraceae bacterium]|nr:response regulator transcription factor [Candidatus Physcocola equi]MCQ2234511.1 response regulator transcription factor [Paludibacteraceae bacterium]
MDKLIKILLCEDDENLGMLLSEYLETKGYSTDLEKDGEAGFNAFTKNNYDICILDVMMPKKDGLTLAREIRNINENIPIIFLTAKTMREDILEGFKAGADDYMTKPFSMEELMMRVQAILRRTNTKRTHVRLVYKIGKFTFDSQKQLWYDENGVADKMTSKESELLNLLCENANNMLERSYALKTIWMEDNFFNARSMDVYITKLRKRIKNDPSVEIMNIHGKGYKIVIPNQESDD